MPPTPGPSPSSAPKPLTARKNRIQPVTPLLSSEPANKLDGKNRAATDPVLPKPLITGTTNPVNQLRQKYSQSKKAIKASKDGDAVHHWSASPPPAMAHKASQVLGVYPTNDNQRETPPASAPPYSGTPDPFRTSMEGSSGRSMSPNRQAHSTPVLTRRYLRENKLFAPVGTKSSQESTKAPKPSVEGKEQSRSIKETITSDDSFNLAGFGMSGKQMEVEYVRQNEMQRVMSFSGVIEHPDSLHEGESLMQSNSARHDLVEQSLRQPQSGEVLRPTVYPSGSFAGVWENDPDVVVRRVDDLQELVEKGFKNLRSELKEMRKEVSTIRRDHLNASKASESLKDSVDLLGTKLDQVDQTINDMESHHQHGAVEASASGRARIPRIDVLNNRVHQQCLVKISDSHTRAVRLTHQSILREPSALVVGVGARLPRVEALRGGTMKEA
ncbi:MAG: hypothetical protein LQ350_002168 [Teloschistes chrysophthalmus]|nr:MAG: hypothetical protein LQ350_002168 [Niorma chrysophthalma]